MTVDGTMTSRFGLWASLATAAAAIGYAVPQLLQVAGVLPDPIDRILIFAPSLVLAPCFVVTMAALHVVAAPERQAWSLSALGIAVMYAVLVSFVYVTQLGVVIPHQIAGHGDAVAFLACCGSGQFLTAVDLLGYTLMSVATALAGGALDGRGAGSAARVWLILNGLLAPFLIGQLAFPALIAVGALWLISFPGAMIALALFFRRPLPVAA